MQPGYVDSDDAAKVQALNAVDRWNERCAEDW
jgi:hypothetical protein